MRLLCILIAKRRLAWDTVFMEVDMKTKSVVRALDKILNADKRADSKIIFTVGKKQVEIIDQGGNAICLPMINGQVVHNGNHTIKNIVSFLVGDLNADQLDYLQTLRSLYLQSQNESRIETAKTYQSIVDFTKGVK